MSVQWISSHPEECEYIFCFAEQLQVTDIRFNDGYLTRVCDPHTNIASALRLFANILNKACSYNSKLLHGNIQNLLIDLLKYETFMDEVHDLYDIDNSFIDSEEYETDALCEDLTDLDVKHSNLLLVHNDANIAKTKLYEAQKLLRYYQG
eukprot:342646_1